MVTAISCPLKAGKTWILRLVSACNRVLISVCNYDVIFGWARMPFQVVNVQRSCLTCCRLVTWKLLVTDLKLPTNCSQALQLSPSHSQVCILQAMGNQKNSRAGKATGQRETAKGNKESTRPVERPSYFDVPLHCDEFQQFSHSTISYVLY